MLIIRFSMRDFGLTFRADKRGQLPIAANVSAESMTKPWHCISPATPRAAHYMCIPRLRPVREIISRHNIVAQRALDDGSYLASACARSYGGAEVSLS